MDNVIAVITDSDFNLEKKELNKPFMRYSSRGIVFNKDGMIAVFHKAKMNEYKLPGGGIEKGESFCEAFKREVFEETGCKIKNIEEIGITIEEKTQNNFCQISHVFKAEVLNNTNRLHLTNKEIEEGGNLLWLDINDAYNKIMESINNFVATNYESKYQNLFIIKRDALILKYYIDKYYQDHVVRK